ncbi:MAG: mur ligase domain-containing protein [Candidatus Woesebacteria bacterium GW2011_GWA1_41_13b]|uniref:Lipid II isoglutaminyl synthase (glutamine-hydrolyzing) subunit MurT n=1 Tax=Candidatus Woesebacteria bacterium GW2011_GWA1_41_13b TaxID=1618555 RepID=A0A0G0X5Y5_9BACT|nr:MAG: mur ligase domain-containing protein [Candidatus Woesebacteria bacterium GW2011_GWA1_41_13b]
MGYNKGMSARIRIAIVAAKVTSLFIKFLGLGAGATWPGEIALTLAPNILASFAPQFAKGIILIAGTNGKTTTSLMLTKILEAQGNRVIHNASGANLLNGVVSACIQHASWDGGLNVDYGVFEVDENSLPSVIFNFQFSIFKKEKQLVLVLLNLFRDQLDRYGEVDVIAEKWEKTLRLAVLAQGTQPVLTLVANADDPGVAHLTLSLRAKRSNLSLEGIATPFGLAMTFFGLNEPEEFLKTAEHATDSTFCLNCGSRLTYEGVYYSHIGIWRCEKCGEKRPKPDIYEWKSPLPGLYNRYNTLAAVTTALSVGIKKDIIKKALTDFTPAFGRQEEFMVDGKKVKIFLSKNPAGFNASLRTVLEMKPKILLIVLNDRIPDGRDVSWIWDVDFEEIAHDKTIKVFASGDRVYDLGVRLKYAEVSTTGVYGNLREAMGKALAATERGETLYVLPTYSAMLEVRKILTGRKIL